MLKLRSLKLPVTLAMAFPLLFSVAPAAGEEEKPGIREAMLRTYIHGVNDALAKEIVTDADLPELRRLLAEPGFPRRDNIVAFLAHRDGSEAVAPLLAFLQNPPASVAVAEEDRALLLAPRALGHLARRGSLVALDALLTISGPGRGVLVAAASRGSNPASLLLDLQERALRGLVESERPEARARLLAIANGEVALTGGNDLTAKAREILSVFDERVGPSGSSVVAPAGPRLDGAPAPGGGPAGRSLPEGQVTPPSPEVLDTQTSSHDSLLTWSNHPNHPDPVLDARCVAIMRNATLKAAKADYADDVSCCVSVTASGTAHTFGTAGDGLDTIDSSTELNSVLQNPASRVHVVREINYCGGSGTNIIGCAYVGNFGMAVVRLTNLVDEGGLWMHEYGHNTGLNHSSDTRAIMYFSLGAARFLSQTECTTYHFSGVAVGACGDPDGDLIGGTADNCPNVSNVSQADQDNDGVGDACDPCPTLPVCDSDGDGHFDNVDNCPGISNPGQENIDGDSFGDVCDPCPYDLYNDSDVDSLCFPADNCPAVYNPGQANADSDEYGDICDFCPNDPLNDPDGDLLCGGVDNCPSANNPGQEDQDGDGVGNVCDPDIDGDGVSNASDNCSVTVNPGQQNADGDSRGDACDPCPLDALDDADADGRCANVDNCPTMANADQVDWDSDGLGNPCDSDREGDGAANGTDNCANDVNPLQEDRDRDGIGNACDQILTVGQSGPAQFGTIQSAINAASSGDVVVVGPGVYHENLTMKAGVNVIGPGPALATVDGTGVADLPIVSIVDLSPGVRFSGFKVTGSQVSAGLSGGGFWIRRSNAEVDGNLITGNHATVGAGIFARQDETFAQSYAPVITNNVITGNDAVDNGGGVIVHYGGPGSTIRHNTISDNTSQNFNAGVQIITTNGIEISNNVVSGNSSPVSSLADGVVVLDSTGVAPHHNDLYDNLSGNFYPPEQDPTGVDGNVSVAPGFTNPAGGDFSPAAASPLVDAGSALGDPPLDQIGTLRPLEGNGGGPAGSDIGALERIPPDADGDGVANAVDKCPYVADPAQADSDGDGVGNACDNCSAKPNSSQSDLDRDGFGDVCDNCPVVSNPDQTDSHGFGVGDVCQPPDADVDSVPDSNDCAPGDPTAYFTPVEVASVTVLGKVVTDVSWPAQDAGTGTRYDVCGGILNELRSDHNFTRVGCLSNNQATTSMSDSRPNPASGNGFYYLLRATNACGNGTYGTGRASPDPRLYLNAPGTAPCP